MVRERDVQGILEVASADEWPILRVCVCVCVCARARVRVCLKAGGENLFHASLLVSGPASNHIYI